MLKDLLDIAVLMVRDRADFEQVMNRKVRVQLCRGGEVVGRVDEKSAQERIHLFGSVTAIELDERFQFREPVGEVKGDVFCHIGGQFRL